MSYHAGKNPGFPFSIELWRGTNLSFQAVQVWAKGTIPTYDGQSLGNKFSERRAEVAMAEIQ